MHDLSYVIWIVSVAALVLLPPALMLIRWARPKWMSMWGMLGVLLLGGWLLTNVQLHVRLAYLGQIVQTMPEPDPDDPIVREWMGDGPKVLFALFLGWMVGPVLWLLWSPLFGSVRIGQRLLSRHGDAE